MKLQVIEDDVRPRRPTLRAKRLHLNTQSEPVVVLRSDCHVCRSEGFSARSQILLSNDGHEVQATLYQIEGDDLLATDEAGLSESAWRLLNVQDGEAVEVSHAPMLESLASVRRRIYGARLDGPAFDAIVHDVVAGRYTEVHLASFLTASAAFPLDETEIYELTRAMVDVGERLDWDSPLVMDKHCVGGLPGNRTTPIVVSIVAAHGLFIPKTSSRAITSPAGTADTMETLAPVDLDLDALKRVVEVEGGCIAWGGAVHLSPADDRFVKIEREMDIDTEGQLIASVLSKKLAAGATHVVFDIPIGVTAKVRTQEDGDRLARLTEAVAARFGLNVQCLKTDGSQPVGRGIGPALEAHDVLAVLKNQADAPDDLRQRSALIAGAALEMGGKASAGAGVRLALQTILDGRAWSKFQRICEAQGGLRMPPRARCRQALTAPVSGRVVHINSRKLARLAKLAGAPKAQAAGVLMDIRLGSEIERGQPMLHVHADTPAELDYALDYAERSPDIIEVELPT